MTFPRGPGLWESPDPDRSGRGGEGGQSLECRDMEESILLQQQIVVQPENGLQGQGRPCQREVNKYPCVVGISVD
jgi:hypothetical protein